MNLLNQLRNLLVMAAADGSLTEREIKFLSDRCQRWSISPDDFAECIRYAISKDSELQIPKTHETRVEMLRDLIRMMAADGELAELEKELFARASVQMGFSDADLQRIIDSVVKTP